MPGGLASLVTSASLRSDTIYLITSHQLHTSSSSLLLQIKQLSAFFFKQSTGACTSNYLPSAEAGPAATYYVVLVA
jgi:hypothetical protein